MRRLPPLTSIKAFEAAARHSNFKSAAQELHVTPGAVSLQIRQLEEWLGAPLFNRSGKNLELSAKGKAYLPELTAALNLLANATEQLMGDGVAGPLRLTVLPSFAQQWLLPRLGQFKAAYPDIELILDTSPESKELGSQQFDLAIRSGTGRWRGMHSELIAHESLVPMCSPQLLNGKLRLSTPADLLHAPLLHDAPKDGWPRWFAAQALPAVADGDCKGYRFDDSGLLLQAAANGLGIALGRHFLARDLLKAGTLVTLFPDGIPNDYSYWLVYPQATAKPARIQAFRDWLMAEVTAPR
jgi:LysR family glycine cleavage system transcriptional activator